MSLVAGLGGLPAWPGASERLMARPRVLLAVDFDGCLAPFVLNPADARPLPAARDALHRLAALPGVSVALVSGRPVRQLAARHPGATVETKPTSAVLHTRGAARPVAVQATAEALASVATWSGVHVTPGKEVVEIAVTDVTKGDALRRLRALVGLPDGRGGVLYAGDDVTTSAPSPSSTMMRGTSP